MTNSLALKEVWIGVVAGRNLDFQLRIEYPHLTASMVKKRNARVRTVSTCLLHFRASMMASTVWKVRYRASEYHHPCVAGCEDRLAKISQHLFATDGLTKISRR